MLPLAKLVAGLLYPAAINISPTLNGSFDLLSIALGDFLTINQATLEASLS